MSIQRRNILLGSLAVVPLTFYSALRSPPKPTHRASRFPNSQEPSP